MLLKRPLLFTALGVLFLSLGVITTLSIITGLQLGEPLAWQHWVYAILNFLFAYGFFSMQAWLLPLLGVVVGAHILLATLRFANNELTSTSLGISAIIIFCGATVVWTLHKRKRKLRTNTHSHITGLLCASMLLVIFGYTIGIYVV